VVLAVISTFGMGRSNEIAKGLIGPLKKLGLRDLDHGQHAEGHEEGHGANRIVILGFFRARAHL